LKLIRSGAAAGRETHLDSRLLLQQLLVLVQVVLAAAAVRNTCADAEGSGCAGGVNVLYETLIIRVVADWRSRAAHMRQSNGASTERKKESTLWAPENRITCVRLGDPKAICGVVRWVRAAHDGAVRHSRESRHSKKTKTSKSCQTVSSLAICHLVEARKGVRRGAGSDAGVTHRRRTSGSRCRRSYRRLTSARPHSLPSRTELPCRNSSSPALRKPLKVKAASKRCQEVLKKPANDPPRMLAARRPIAADMKAAPKISGGREQMRRRWTPTFVWRRNLKK